MRSSRYGSMSIAPDYATLTTQYAVAANATFANLNTAAGWNTQGSADIASGTATLSEVSTSQTRLSQVFMLNEQDRYLSFTLSGAALDDLNGAPDDAFEVALLDANTGLSVLGSNGLTRTDAFLNLQADGTQRLADCVTCIDNPDGSRTYRVDLTGVTKNAAVNLSFDLLGFGKDNSHVTLSDIRVSGLPQLHDEAAVLAEDNLLTFDPFAQADAALRPMLASSVVSAPTHGAITVNAEGTFSYTPDLDYFGTDTFSYRLSDGPLDSNLATVSLMVTPVNDAPVAADVALTTDEDTALVIDLRSYASDVDSTVFTANVVNAPTHGVLTQNVDGTFTYLADANYNGADSFTYRVNDGALDSNLATVSLNVTSVNDAPTLGDLNLSAVEDTALAMNLLAAANDIDGDVLTASIVATAQHGQVSINADGSFTYTPDANYNGADSFTYKVSDGELDSNIATVSLNIAAVNDAPIAADTQAATDEDTPLNLDLLAAASDVDGDVLTPVIIAGPLHGQLVSNPDGSFTYTPDANYFGADSFTYKVSDAQSSVLDPQSSGIVTVSLTINAVNDAPVAVSATVTGTEDTPYIFTWSDFKVSDVDSADLAITINTPPADGLLQHFDGIQWLAVLAGQRITKADIDAGCLCFGPDVNESGFAGYGLAGTGNNMQNYAGFTYQADDGFLSSTVASMTVNIVPVADAPSLALTAPVDAYGATALRFSTGWEIAPNRNPTFTILPQSTLDGWYVVRETGDTGQQAFIIWSGGDKMKDANNANQIVAAAPNGGKNWLEIGNANGLGHQTYGIERSVDTRAGVAYHLSLDYAGRLGYGIDFTGIGIYVDGVRIATHAGTSPNTALNWEALNFSFTGTGTAQTIRIVTEATSSQSNGRGAMIDNIVLTENLPINTGYQDSPINLSSVVAALTDTDGSEVIGVTMGAIPTGALITDGTHSFSATDSMHIVAVAGWNLATLSITAPTGYTGQFALTVAVSSCEIATGEISNNAITLPVTVVPTNVTSPLVIDLNGDGVRTTALGATQGSFDLLNNGHSIRSGWISAQDGFLATDSNGNGRIDDRSELFGGSLGEGYAKLAGFDSNRDGVVDAKDARFNELRIWQDANGNHQTDAGELRSLADRGIEGLDVNHTIAPEVQNGNWLIERGTVTFSDGHTAAMADAYFEIAEQESGISGRSGSTRQPFDAAGAARPANGNSASITLRSEPQQPQIPGQPQILGIPAGAESVREKFGSISAQYFADRQIRAPAVIDWGAQTNQRATSGNQAESDDTRKKRKGKTNWLADFLGVTPSAVNLAESTGLNVKMPAAEEPKQPFVERSQRRSRDSDASKPTSEG
ncbi:MAG: hypothetical protein A3H31_08415 [Gallionellales bacterium RIFCSPLOWO2_02_FULL_57_47]|nr:MAG: hypothetical protein A3H31_08415 [Gallionellales bacterium RIFCSPLOWO2_02_FULL_57_47]